MRPLSPDELARHLERLPEEGWNPPAPPPAPWPEERPSRGWLPGGGMVPRPLTAALASIALLATGLAAGLLVASDDSAKNGVEGATVRVDLRPVNGRGRGAEGTVRLEPRAGSAAKVALRGLPPSRAGDFYEVWLLGEGGELVSLGSVRVPESGEAELTVQLPVDPRRFRYLDVSREPADGDPSHSTISVLRGPAV